MDEETIRRQLRKGNTINKVCTEHNLSFAELINIMRTYDNPVRRKTSKGMAYIYRMSNGHYSITRSSNHYGTYKTLRDAQKVRDWFRSNGWNSKWVDLACRECNVERCRR